MDTINQDLAIQDPQDPQDPQDLPPWYDPALHRICKNGAIQDRATGRFLKPGHLITPETASEYHQMRREKILLAQAAAGRGLAAAARTKDYLEGWARIVESMADLAINEDRVTAAGARVKAAEFIGQALGVTGDLRQVNQDPGPAADGITIHLAPAAVEQLRSFVGYARTRINGSPPGRQDAPPQNEAADPVV